MATSPSTVQFLLDQLGSLAGIRAQKMFGEYAVYYEEKVVLLVCDNQVFVKLTPQGRELLGPRYAEGHPYPGAKPAILLGAETLEDADFFAELVRTTAASLPPPKPKQPKKATRRH